MSRRIVVDMNLSPEWIPLLAQAGWPAVHWSAVGDPTAYDATIIAWALTHGHAVFTHDLGFGTALALTHAGGPSVIQDETLDRGGRLRSRHGFRLFEGFFAIEAAWSFARPDRSMLTTMKPCGSQGAFVKS